GCGAQAAPGRCAPRAHRSGGGAPLRRARLRRHAARRRCGRGERDQARPLPTLRDQEGALPRPPGAASRATAAFRPAPRTRRAAPEERLAARLPAILDGWFAYVEARPQAWTMIFRDSSGDAEIKAVRKELQESARGVIAALLRGQPELSIADEEVEPLAELLR